jgi:hypothetical protein
LQLKRAAVLPHGAGKFTLRSVGTSKPESAVGIWKVRVFGNSEKVGE